MISNLTFNEQSLHFAQLSELAYSDGDPFNSLQYQSIFLNRKGTQAYILWNEDDIVIVCRGTEPTQFDDIRSDIDLKLVTCHSGHGQVHAGFKRSVDRIWPDIVSFLKDKPQKVWCTGHSLGAAMATLITARLYNDVILPDPVLFTYGSPRVGDQTYVNYLNALSVTHYRWVNNADIVTRNPLLPYVHHGELFYFNHHGILSKMTWWRLVKDRVKGFYVGLKRGKVNFFVNHLIENYIKNLENLK